MSLKELRRSGGFSLTTFFKGISMFGGMQASNVSRLRNLDSENTKLKKLFVENHLEIHALKSIFVVKR
jgi:putative transposase